MKLGKNEQTCPRNQFCQSGRCRQDQLPAGSEEGTEAGAGVTCGQDMGEREQDPPGALFQGSRQDWGSQAWIFNPCRCSHPNLQLRLPPKSEFVLQSSSPLTSRKVNIERCGLVGPRFCSQGWERAQLCTGRTWAGVQGWTSQACVICALPPGLDENGVPHF